MLKRKLSFAVTLLLLSQSAFAADAPLPSGGGQIQQIPHVPIPQQAVPDIRVEQGNALATPASDNVKILVKSLHVTGQAVFSEEELVAITGFSPGGELTLSDLRSMASKIADHYHTNGYFVAQAYLPAQDIKDGAVTITVLERDTTAVLPCTTRQTFPMDWRTDCLTPRKKVPRSLSLRLSPASCYFPIFPA